MTSSQRVLAECVANPHADAPRLVFAEVLRQENDLPSSEFVRAQLRVAVARRAAGKRVRGIEREAAALFAPPALRQLAAAPVEHWLHAHSENASRVSYGWGRGLPEAATVDASALANDGAALRARMPLLDLTVFKLNKVGPAFFELPVLAGIRSLRFSASRVNLGLVEALAKSPFLADLRVLELDHCDLPPEALHCIAASPLLSKLRHVRLDGNCFEDPNPVADEDESGYRGDRPSAAGEALRQRYGNLSWLPGFSVGYEPVPEALSDAGASKSGTLQETALQTRDALIDHIRSNTHDADARREAERDERIKKGLDELGRAGMRPPPMRNARGDD